MKIGEVLAYEGGIGETRIKGIRNQVNGLRNLRMNQLQLIVNSAMRLDGANQVEPGLYVVADEWSVKEVLGNKLEVINLAMRPKGLAINFTDKKTLVTYDLKSAEMERIKNLSRYPYNRDVGYYWGVELLTAINNELLTWFLCTASLRKMIPQDVNLIVESEFVERYNFWTPKITKAEFELESKVRPDLDMLEKWVKGFDLHDF